MPQIEKVAEVIERELQFSPGDSIPDYGCGTGLLGFLLLKNAGHATFCDVSEGMLEQVMLKSEQYGKAKVLAI
jgi:ubiquinone/menaquinone biosynthesis C-methylase UbiE